MDGSNSIDENEWRKTQDFVINLIKAFPISPDGTHVGVVEFGKDAKIQIHFSNFTERSSLIQAVNNIKQGKYVGSTWFVCLFICWFDYLFVACVFSLSAFVFVFLFWSCLFKDIFFYKHIKKHLHTQKKPQDITIQGNIK